MKMISDLYFAAALLALEKPYDEIKSINGRKKFIFSGEVKEAIIIEDGKLKRIKDISLDDIESKHVGGCLFLPTNSYSSAIRNMKSVIHAAEQQ